MIPYGRQSVDEDDIASVVDVLRGQLLTLTRLMIGQEQRSLRSLAMTY
jgi:hypothetical protein